MLLDKADKYEIRKRLDEIDRKTSISCAERTRLLTELSRILLHLEYKKNTSVLLIIVMIITD